MSRNQKNKEIEIRFKEIDEESIISKLKSLGFEDLGEDFFTEIIFYDEMGEWIKNRKIETRYVRLRKTKKGVILTYKKHRQDINTPEAEEIEFEISDINSAKNLLEAIGLRAFRQQEKKRRSFKKGDVIVDIDSWPQVPVYLEIEARDEELLKETAKLLNLDWKDAIYENAGNLIEKYYGLMVSKMSLYTFDKIEYRKD